VPKSTSAATDLDLICQFRAIPDPRMRRGVRIPAWYLLLLAVLSLELCRPPSNSAFRHFLRQVVVAALCATISDLTIAQIPGGARFNPKPDA